MIRECAPSRWRASSAVRLQCQSHSELTEEAEIALTVRLKHDVSAVGRPDRMPIVAAKCQATRRGSGVEIVDPDVRLALAGDVRDALSVWRYPRRLKHARSELQNFHIAACIYHDEVRDRRRRRHRCRTWNVDERAVA